MEERGEAIVRHLQSTVKWPLDIIVVCPDASILHNQVDNGSEKPVEWASVRIEQNVQTTHGWLVGLQYAESLAFTKHKQPYLAYWFLITSGGPASGPDARMDILSPMAQFLIDTPTAAGIHPALTAASSTYWEHLKARGGIEPRQTWMIDNIAALWRADFFTSVGKFEKKATFAWGIDLEVSWLARRAYRTLYVDERVRWEKITNIAYSLNRMGMSAGDRDTQAREEMHSVYVAKYNNPNIMWMFENDLVDSELR